MVDFLDGGNAGSFDTSYKWRFQDYFASLPQQQEFYATGGTDEFIVPDGVTSLRVYLAGGNGGSFSRGGGGFGGRVYGQLSVTPGETLYITVGGNGGKSSTLSGAPGGFNGGGQGGDGVNSGSATTSYGGCGGGGATDIRRGGNDLINRIAVAAGGGGQGNPGYSDSAKIGGSGGAATGENGVGTSGGRGGTSAAGGAGLSGTDDGGLGYGGDGDSNPIGSGPGGGGAGLYGGSAGRINTASSGVRRNGYGGGGGSNYVGGFDSAARSFRGDRTSHQVDPMCRITYHLQPDVYVWEINPNDGGSPEVQKNITVSQNVGPNRLNILQEGQSQAPVISFSGVILSQDHYERLEQWFDRRTFIKLTDDLGRDFYGVFSKFSPKRQRRNNTPWYHTYEATFHVSAYTQASGEMVYGRLPEPVVQ